MEGNTRGKEFGFVETRDGAIDSRFQLTTSFKMRQLRVIRPMPAPAAARRPHVPEQKASKHMRIAVIYMNGWLPPAAAGMNHAPCVVGDGGFRVVSEQRLKKESG